MQARTAPRGGRLVVRPLRRETNRLVEEVHERLVAMVADGRLAPNTRLYQERLAQDLGVSRTPIREALLRLEREGLVRTQPGGGIYVKALSEAEVAELYQVREILEPFAARLACERATPRDVAEVEAVHERIRRLPPTDLARGFRLNHDLHTRLVRPCGNGLLLRFLEIVWAQASAVRIYAFYAQEAERAERMVKEHHMILTAFAGGRAEEVEELLRSHIQGAHHELVERLDNRDLGS